LEKRIGNVQLLQILCDAHDRSNQAATDNEYDNIVWEAVERSLAAALPGARELIVVVGGIDEASCGEDALFQRLTKATANGTNVRLITLGRKTHQIAGGLRSIHIGEDLIVDDIMAVVRRDFQSDHEFSEMSEFEQESTITRLSEVSAGSFLWAKMATRRLRRAIGLDKLRDAINTVVNTKPTIHDFVLREAQSQSMNHEAKLMLVWLAISNRPLSLRELETLVSIELDKSTVSGKRIDVFATLKPVQGLVFLKDGLMHIRHGLIRSSLLDMLAKGALVPTLEDARADLVARLLLYIKTVVPDKHKPSFVVLDSHETSQLLDKHPLLDLAIRHWPVHLTQTAIFAREGEKGAAHAFSGVYPTSITAMLLQASLWEHRPKPTLLAYQTTITNICHELFTTKSSLTLQALIFLGILNRQVGRVDQAASSFFEATLMSNELLGPGDVVTTEMASSYIELTESEVTKVKATGSRTDIMTKRGEILVILAECYKTQFGESSAQVITTLWQRVEHYRCLHEEQEAQQIIRLISSSSKKQEGPEYSDAYNDFSVLLGGVEHTTTVDEGDTLYLDVEEHDDLIERSEPYDFDLLLGNADNAVAEGRIGTGERLYLDLWHRLSQENRAQHSDLWVERNLRAMLRYSKFLHAQGRKAEASAVLASVWEEHSQSTSLAAMTETSASLLTQIAHEMQSVGLSSAALSVFKYCAQYYRDTNNTQTSTYGEIQQSIHVTSQEILQSSSSSMTVLSETTLEEMVIESSSSLSTAGQTTLTATNNLVSLYTSHHRWCDATRLLEKVLRGLWPSLFSVNVQDVTLVEEHVETCVDLARRLAECYHMRRRFTQEEDIRVRVYRALRSTREVDDKLRERATNELVTFYNRTSQTERVITLRQEMLGDYTEHYGEQYPTVIKMLWKLAELTRPRPIFIEYYQKIIRALNKNSQTTTPEALEPVVLVATELWSKGLYSDALPYYRTLFVTFLNKPAISPKFEDQAWVRECFVRYTDCMRSLRTPFSVIHRATAEYHAQCKKLHGATASITIQATLALAKLCQESTSYTQQAMTLYEELLQMESGEIDRQDLSDNLEMLRNEQRATDISSSLDSTEVSPSKISHTVTALRKRITSVREEYGWAHQESLSNLTELVRLNTKQEKTETAVHELRKATINILETETTATRLIEAASTIASNYLAIKESQKATQLLEQVYSQIVMKEVADSGTSEFDLTARGRESLVFLAKLEYSLRRSSATSLTEILASLTTEYVYFEEFRTLVTSSNSFYDVSMSAARLRHSLVSSGRCAAAVYVFERTSRWFMDTEAKRLNLTTALSAVQVKRLLQNVLDHLDTHKSEDMVRTVGIIGSVQVVQLRNKGRFDEACDLAMACFRYIVANNKTYRTNPIIAKLVLKMGLAVGARETTTATAEPTEGPGAETRKKLVKTSGTILHDVIKVLDAMKINLAKLDLVHLNRLIGLVGEQQDWPTLASLLACLWASRDTQRNWPPSVTFALARRHILARWFAGDSMAALRMAEHVVYNCRRVHSLRHPATLEMSVLLSQLYTGTAQRYQQQKESGPEARDMANRYYRKAAAIHENILRVFTDPVYASMDDSTLMDDTNGGASPSIDGELSPRLQKTFGDLPAHHGQHVQDDDGHHVRQHLLLLKLAVQRLGCWPKDYAEYERLNADAFREYHADLKDVGGVEKWDLSAFGEGKAEADYDLLRPEDCKDWELMDANYVINGDVGQGEEEL
jgi:hypothetical protein